VLLSLLYGLCLKIFRAFPEIVSQFNQLDSTGIIQRKAIR